MLQQEFLIERNLGAFTHFVDLFSLYLMRILVEDVGILPRYLGPASTPSF